MSERLGALKWVRPLLLGLLLPSAGMAELEVPFLSGRVNDPTELLRAESESRIEGTLMPSSSTSTMGLGERLIGGGLFLCVIGMFSLLALHSPGLLAWFLYVFLTPFWTLFPLVLSGSRLGLLPVVLWLAGFPILRILGRRGRGAEKGGWRRIFVPLGTGGWRSTSGWSGGGFSSRGFSADGGSFGGGGSSSSW